jgi:hypothetical protein
MTNNTRWGDSIGAVPVSVDFCHSTALSAENASVVFSGVFSGYRRPEGNDR